MHEPVLDKSAYTALVQRVYDATGISLGAGKRELVRSRIGRRLRALGLPSYRDYLAHLEQTPAELTEMVSAITTNLTYFFREEHHFELLAAELAARRAPTRVWSSACATGEEPYSIAMVAREARVDVSVLATDIDQAVLAEAQAGIYPLERLERVTPERRRRHFVRGVGPREGLARVRPELRRMVDFQSLNLIGAWPHRGAFDVIFCRNVLIYFDVPSQERLLRRLIEALTPGGVLFLGHSESLRASAAAMTALGRTAFRRSP